MNPSKPVRVPETLRAFIFYATRFPPLYHLASKYYLHAANVISERYLQLEGVKEVIWFGGSLTRLEPGISDLDLLIVTDRLPNEEFLKKLKLEYVALRRKFPLLIDLHVVNETYWNFFQSFPSSSALWMLGALKKQRSAGWQEIFWDKEGMDPRHWLGLGLFHYIRASRHAFRTKEHVLAESNFQREIGKAKAFFTRSLLSRRLSDKTHLLLTEAMNSAQHAYSLLDFNERIDSNSKLRPEYASDAGDRFLNEMAQRRWHRVLRKGPAKNLPINPGEIPDTLIWNGSSPVTPEFMAKLAEAIRTSPIEPHTMPVLLSQELHDFILSGWSWGRFGPQCSWVALSRRADTEWNNRLGKESFDRFRDRLGNALLFLFGNRVSGTTHQVREGLREIAWTALSLQTGVLTGNVEKLLSLAEGMLPACRATLTAAGTDQELRLVMEMVWQEGFETLLGKANSKSMFSSNILSSKL